MNSKLHLLKSWLKILATMLHWEWIPSEVEACHHSSHLEEIKFSKEWKQQLKYHLQCPISCNSESSTIFQKSFLVSDPSSRSLTLGPWTPITVAIQAIWLRGSWASSLAPMMNSFSGGPFHIILPRERRFSVWAGWSGDNGALFLDVLSLSPDMEASYDWTLYSSLLILSLKLLLVVSTPLLLLIFSLNMVAFSFRIICGRGAWLKVWCRLYLEVKLAVSWVRLLIVHNVQHLSEIIEFLYKHF